MNIYDYAMQKEKKQGDYYRELSGQTNNPGLKNILIMLARDEDKHYAIVKQLKEQQKGDLIETPILEEAQAIFGEMKERNTEEHLDVAQIDLYRKAQEFEKQAENDYAQKAEIAGDTYQKTVFLKLAEEERKHYFLLDNIIEMLMRPHHWLENAEFFHLSDY